MTPSEAVIHAFSTVSTGGYPGKDLSIMSYNSSYFEIVITVFMILSSINFSLFYMAALRRFKALNKSEELRLFFIIYIFSIIIIAISIAPLFVNLADAIRSAAFHSSSFISTTGFYSTEIGNWPIDARAVLILLMLIGGCAGSTACGLKVSRLILVFKNLKRQLKKSSEPNLVSVIRLDGQPVDEANVDAAQSYFVLYIAILFISAFLLSFDKYNLETSFLSAASAFNNLGLGWGEIGVRGTYADFSVFSKLVIALDMLLGRLEILPLFMALSAVGRPKFGRLTLTRKK